MFKRDKYAPKNIQAIDKVRERRLNNLNFISLNWTSQKLPDKVQRHWISKYSSLCWHGRYRHPLTSEYFYLGNWGQAERSLDIEPAISKPTLTWQTTERQFMNLNSLNSNIVLVTKETNKTHVPVSASSSTWYLL